jgi:hypothetical protein
MVVDTGLATTQQVPQTTAADSGGSGGSVESHLDSFFEESGWTRDDLILVLLVIQTAVLLSTVVGINIFTD